MVLKPSGNGPPPSMWLVFFASIVGATTALALHHYIDHRDQICLAVTARPG